MKRYYKNLTITGKTDGFGCQLNAVFSGVAYCENISHYRYVHTPFNTISHGFESQEWVDKINNFVGIPDMRRGRKIHVKSKYMKAVFRNPAQWYKTKVLAKLRYWYWKHKTPSDVDIVVHIRRGDIKPNHPSAGQAARFMPNEWYNQRLPIIFAQYPDDYRITIHSEGDFSDFESIIDNWPKSIIDRITWKLGVNMSSDCQNNMLEAFHDMASAKVLIQSKSGLSYTSGILNHNDVFFKMGSMAIGQTLPIDNWKVIQ